MDWNKNKTISTKTQEKPPKSHWSSVEVARAPSLFYAPNWSIKETIKHLPCLSCTIRFHGEQRMENRTSTHHMPPDVMQVPMLMKNFYPQKLKLYLFKSLTWRNTEDTGNKIKDTRKWSESQNRKVCRTHDSGISRSKCKGQGEDEQRN